MRLCVIPARGNSKRIPKKNIKNFHGKPIIAWSIELAIKSKCFDKIIVSTDDAKISKIAKDYGAETPFVRPKNLSDDHTETVHVISHAIQWYIRRNIKPQYVCCIYATAPFVKIKDLKRGLKILKKTKCNFTFLATNYNYPIQRSFKIKNNGKLKMFYPKYLNYRSQDLEQSYHDVGQFYWGTADAWSKKKNIISTNSIPILISRESAVDIDTQEDWKIAEKVFKNFKPK